MAVTRRAVMQRGSKKEVRAMVRQAHRRQMHSHGLEPAVKLSCHGLRGRAALPGSSTCLT